MNPMKKIMNKFTLVIALMLSGTVLFGQGGAVTSASLYQKEGDLLRAKQQIDQAVVHEKTKADPKAWYHKGLIYTDLARTQNASYKALSADPLKEAVDAFTKAKEFDPAKKQYYKLADEGLQALWGDVINKGVEEYNKEKLKDALTWFELARVLNVKDTLGPLYACAAAEAIGDMNSLKSNTQHLVSLNYKSPDVYRSRIKIEEDPARKLEIAKQAQTDYPKDNSLTELLGDTYFQVGKHEEALATYQLLASRVPEQAGLNTKIAFQYQKLKQPDKALEYYEKTVKLSNTNFLAHYNATVLYYEKGRELYEKVHKLNVSDYQNQGKQMEEEMKLLLGKAASHGNIALTQTTDETDKKNINLLLSEIKKMTSK